MYFIFINCTLACNVKKTFLNLFLQPYKKHTVFLKWLRRIEKMFSARGPNDNNFKELLYSNLGIYF